MKILVISPKYYPDNFSIIHLVKGFKEKGHEVDVLTSLPFDGNGKFLATYLDKKEEIVDGIHIYRVKAYPRAKSALSLILNYLSLERKFNRWVKTTKNKYDVIYTFNISPVTILKAGNIYKDRFKVPHYVHVLDLWPISVHASGYMKKESIFYKYLTNVSKKLYLGADKLIIGSPSFRFYFENELDIHKEFVYIPQPALVGKDSQNQIFNQNDINILYAGNLSKLQMVHFLIPSLEKSKVNNITLHFVGSGKDKAYLMEQAKNSSIKDKIIFHNRLSYEELSDYYFSSDLVFVGINNATPVGNTIPNKLITALAYSKGVLGMLAGDGKDILITTKGGILVRQNIDDLAKAFIAISKSDKKDLNKMGQLNKEYYDKHFNNEVIVRDILSTFSRK